MNVCCNGGMEKHVWVQPKVVLISIHNNLCFFVCVCFFCVFFLGGGFGGAENSRSIFLRRDCLLCYEGINSILQSAKSAKYCTLIT